MIFGQGAIRCHPYLMKEMEAIALPDKDKALEEFDQAFWAHVLGSLQDGGPRLLAQLDMRPLGTSPRRRRCGQVITVSCSRYASVLAFLSDVSLLTLGGALKRKEMLSARLGDILSELYLLSAVLKRFEDEGRVEADGVLVDYCMATGLKTMRIFDRRDHRQFSLAPHGLALARGRSAGCQAAQRPRRDALILRCAKLIAEPSETRARLTSGLYLEEARGGGVLVERAFRLVHETEAGPRQAASGGDQGLARGAG